jgi:hypothetical protein
VEAVDAQEQTASDAHELGEGFSACTINRMQRVTMRFREALPGSSARDIEHRFCILNDGALGPITMHMVLRRSAD